MKSRGHMMISFLKSGLRLGAYMALLGVQGARGAAVVLILAEVFGFVEELVDKRG